MAECQFCKSSRFIYSVNVPVEDEPGVFTTRKVCGDCVDTIHAMVSARVSILEARIAKLEKRLKRQAFDKTLPDW